MFLAKKEGQVIGGVWVIKTTSFAWHTQYIAKQYAENEQYVIPTLLIKLKEIAKIENQKVLSLGSCDGGYESDFSPSLCDFKMKLGAQICYRYKILLK